MEKQKYTFEEWAELLNLEKIKSDLNNEFPFSALWQDIEPQDGLLKFLPLANIILQIIMFILLLILLIKK